MSETTTDLVHDVMGGEISKLRPPAPGFDKPFPHLNQTPKTNPEFPSDEARNALTNKLEMQRNYAQRLTLASGKMPNQQDFSKQTENEHILNNTSSNFSIAPQTADELNKAEMDKNQAQSSLSQSSINQTGLSPSEQPKVIYIPFNHPFPTTLPDINQAPATPITFPGFHIPSSHEALRPDFDITSPTGTLIKFDEESDHLSPGQEKTLTSVLHTRKKRLLILTAFGTLVNNHAGLDPEEQNHALTLALLRARTLSHYFLQNNVPASLIVIKAHPFGEGVRITYQSQPQSPPQSPPSRTLYQKDRK